MAWNKDLPAGDKAWQDGDDAIRDNNDALEESLAKAMVFPGNSDANRGRIVYESFENATERDGEIIVPLPGMRVYLEDHRQPFLYDDNGAWVSMAPGVGTLAERDAIVAPQATARWVATDDKYRTSIYNGSAWVYPEDPAYKDGYTRIAKDGVQDISGTDEVEISSDGNDASPGDNDFWLEDSAPVQGAVYEIEGLASSEISVDADRRMYVWAVVLEDDVETARFPMGSIFSGGSPGKESVNHATGLQRYVMGAGTNLKVKMFARRSASGSWNQSRVRGVLDGDASDSGVTSLTWRIVG